MREKRVVSRTKPRSNGQTNGHTNGHANSYSYADTSVHLASVLWAKHKMATALNGRNGSKTDIGPS